MKIAINRSWGGFSLPKEVARTLGVEVYDDSHAVRTNPALIEMLEAGKKVNDLQLAEIPDNATDYMVDEYDGLESVIYVVNGKLHRD